MNSRQTSAEIDRLSQILALWLELGRDLREMTRLAMVIGNGSARTAEITQTAHLHLEPEAIEQRTSEVARHMKAAGEALAQLHVRAESLACCATKLNDTLAPETAAIEQHIASLNTLHLRSLN